MRINPWIGVVTIAIGVAACLLFARERLDVAVPAGIVSVGCAILMATSHLRIASDYRELKNSIRPPSLVDPHEKNGNVPPASS